MKKERVTADIFSTEGINKIISELHEFNQEKAEQLKMPWQTKFEELRGYVRSEYLEVHIRKQDVKRLEQIQRNIRKWIRQLNEMIDPIYSWKKTPGGYQYDIDVKATKEADKEKGSFTEWLNDIIGDIDRDINYLKDEKLAEDKTEKPKEVDLINNFDETDVKEVYQYFKTHLVDKKRLTEDELKQYLKVAFEKLKQPESRFKLDYNTMKDIQGVFYSYYKDVAGKPYGKQQEYVNLLKDYFVGFENLSTTNFSKIY